jgi:hypothetical protein
MWTDGNRREDWRLEGWEEAGTGLPRGWAVAKWSRAGGRGRGQQAGEKTRRKRRLGKEARRSAWDMMSMKY